MAEMTIDSPCTSICQLDESGTVCIGCYRSRKEIGEWALASDARKREIIATTRQRAGAGGD